MRIANALSGGVDLSNSVQMRAYYETLRSNLYSEQSTWLDKWGQLAQFFLPKWQRFNYNNVDLGYREDQSIVDESATLCLRTLKAGMQTGMSPPTAPWFNFKAENEELNERQEVVDYLESCERIARDSLLKANFYGTSLNAYGEMGLYGNAAYMIIEDPETIFRFHPCPLGSYYIAGDKNRRVDFMMRIVNMTVRQIVDEFGIENCSTAVRSYFDSQSAQKDMWWPLVHVIHRNTYFGTDKAKPKDKAWASVYYELNAYSGADANRGILRNSGYDECPFVCGRWNVLGENFYGFGAAEDIMGTVMGLQTIQTRTLQALDKFVNPPMIADPALMGMQASVLPGDVTYAVTKDGAPGFRPAYQIDFKPEFAVQERADHRKRISRGLYEDLFLMIANDDRSNITAEEIRARIQEKMMVLGPVIHNSIEDVLKPTLNRIMPMLARAGKLPPKPKSMRGQDIKIEFVSILAQAQKSAESVNIDEFMRFVGSEEAVAVGAGADILDNVDLDVMTRTYADYKNIPAKCMRSPEEALARRAQRQKAQQAEAQAQQAQQLAQAGANLQKIPAGGDNALTRLMPSMAGAA